MNSKRVAVTLGVMCALLTSGIIVQINTIKNNTLEGSSSIRTANNELKDEVLRWKEKYERGYQELQLAEEQLDNVRKNATNGNTESTEVEQELKKINMLLGLTEVTGEGIIITVADSKNTSVNDENLVNELVHNTDLIELVNELKNAGAEAISINGQRIISTSYINCVGTVINVNGEKVNSPFVISAVGNSASLSGIERPGSYIQYMKEDGISVKVEKLSSVTIPKYKKVISPKYMKNVK